MKKDDINHLNRLIKETENKLIQVLRENRDLWKQKAIELEARLSVYTHNGSQKKGRQKRSKKREGRRILKLVSINGKSPPRN